MKKSLLFLFLAFNFISIGQLSSQDWLVNLEEAKLEASNNAKTILLVFQGSDWCGPCIKLDHQIWSKEVFQEYATEELVMLQADFPRRKKNRLSEEQSFHNATLAERYNQNGIFPLVVLLDSDGQVLAETGYKDLSPEAYISHLRNLLKS